MNHPIMRTISWTATALSATHRRVRPVSSNPQVNE